MLVSAEIDPVPVFPDFNRGHLLATSTSLDAVAATVNDYL
jgi:hypothetical protein